jgi:hypothetical protein
MLIWYACIKYSARAIETEKYLHCITLPVSYMTLPVSPVYATDPYVQYLTHHNTILHSQGNDNSNTPLRCDTVIYLLMYNKNNVIPANNNKSSHNVA